MINPVVSDGVRTVTNYYEDYGIQSNSYKVSGVTHEFSYLNDFFSTLNKIV